MDQNSFGGTIEWKDQEGNIHGPYPNIVHGGTNTPKGRFLIGSISYDSEGLYWDEDRTEPRFGAAQFIFGLKGIPVKYGNIAMHSKPTVQFDEKMSNGCIRITDNDVCKELFINIWGEVDPKPVIGDDGNIQGNCGQITECVTDDFNWYLRIN